MNSRLNTEREKVTEPEDMPMNRERKSISALGAGASHILFPDSQKLPPYAQV